MPLLVPILLASQLVLPGLASDAPPEVVGAPALRSEPCGDERLCFYGPEGDLVYWAASFMTEFYPDDEARRRNMTARRRIVITGGYAPLEKRQLEYNAWVKRHAPYGGRVYPGISFSAKGRFGWGAVDASFSAPNHLTPNGALSLRTLKAPLCMAAREILILWHRIEEEAERGLPERPIGSPRARDWWMAWNRSRLDSISDPLLRLRAHAVYEASEASSEFGKLVDSLEPLTRTRETVTDPRWKMYVLPDHLEPDQLPPDFMSKLAAAESKIIKAIEDAEALFER